VYSIFYHHTTHCRAVVTHLAIQPHALHKKSGGNTSSALHLTKSYTTAQLMLNPYRCTPSEVANNVQLGQQPFSCEAVYYTRGKAIHPKVYQVLFVLRMDILKNIISHYSLPELETGSMALISPSVARVMLNMSRSVHYIKMLACCTPFAVFPYNTKNFSMSLLWQHNMHTVNFCKWVFTTPNVYFYSPH
jgi:hypothetical protein